MASIDHRKTESLGTVYRVRLRTKDFPAFSLTFRKLEDAEKWVELHEEKFYEDPQKYFNWKAKLRLWNYKPKGPE